MKKANKVIRIIFLAVIILIIGIAYKIYSDHSFAKPEGNVYKNDCFGYTYIYDDSLKCDLSMERVKTTFKNDDIEIEIFYDDFNDNLNNSRTLLNYGNKNIKDNDYVDVKVNKTVYRLFYKVNVLGWERKELSGIENDKNYYLSLQYIKNKNEVYTVLVRSAYSINYKDIINRLSFLKNKEGSIDDLNFDKLKPKVTHDIQTQSGKYYNETFTDEKPMKWGIFYPLACAGDFEALRNLENEIGYKFEVLLDYKSIGISSPNTHLFELKDRVVEYTLQVLGDNTNPIIMYDLLDGKYDDKIKEYAEQIKKIENVVLFRLNNEMNGDWCSYCAWFTQTDTSIYKEVWKYIHNKFKENEVNNILWVWNPNWGDFPAFKWNHYLNYFPGEEYVDIVGVTGYNTGTYYKHEKWRTFEEIYDPMMEEYREYFDYRFMITEFGCSSFGGNKSEWISDMMAKIEKYNFDIAIWFSGTDYDGDGNPARIYTIDENKDVINSFKDGIK